MQVILQMQTSDFRSYLPRPRSATTAITTIVARVTTMQSSSVETFGSIRSIVTRCYTTQMQGQRLVAGG